MVKREYLTNTKTQTDLFNIIHQVIYDLNYEAHEKIAHYQKMVSIKNVKLSSLLFMIPRVYGGKRERLTPIDVSCN